MFKALSELQSVTMKFQLFVRSYLALGTLERTLLAVSGYKHSNVVSKRS